MGEAQQGEAEQCLRPGSHRSRGSDRWTFNKLGKPAVAETGPLTLGIKNIPVAGC